MPNVEIIDTHDFSDTEFFIFCALRIKGKQDQYFVECWKKITTKTGIERTRVLRTDYYESFDQAHFAAMSGTMRLCQG